MKATPAADSEPQKAVLLELHVAEALTLVIALRRLRQEYDKGRYGHPDNRAPDTKDILEAIHAEIERIDPECAEMHFGK